MSRPEVVRLAQAVHGAVHLGVKRHARSHFEGIVDGLDPLEVDLAGQDADPLTDDDITIGRQLERQLADEPLAIGDTLVLIETEGGDYIAVEVLPGDE